ncbi:sulfurtransferase TusA family protein [Hoeflea alexandrii]|uniref:sulfurtransferase TusA family protein n=1 Tax=Hoeflea alexandrii TaxID=288436 RepID=UPI0022AE93FE|nr:sulfurtransferase TusA family protein [Hoeflea alexandrii]MCZ4288422.1 sulfurtransferase TusA family protein [Hoeflea alexandrii]
MNVQILDTRGLKCPLPVIRARKAIKTIGNGQLLRVECTDPLAEIDIPHMVNTDGHDLIGKGKDVEVLWYLIKIVKR